jgi:hypothetical protein
MTDAYIFQVALICADCVVHMGFTQQQCESSVDSDAIPRGPYSEGGGEADCPKHCDRCGVFLHNPLTPDGEDYVRDAYLNTRGACVAEWRDAYSYLFEGIEE